MLDKRIAGELVWAELEALVVAAVLAELSDIGVEERRGNRARRAHEASVRPTRIGLRAIGRQASDGDVIDADAVAGDRAVRLVAEAQLDGLAGIGAQVGGDIHPGGRPE